MNIRQQRRRVNIHSHIHRLMTAVAGKLTVQLPYFCFMNYLDRIKYLTAANDNVRLTYALRYRRRCSFCYIPCKCNTV